MKANLVYIKIVGQVPSAHQSYSGQHEQFSDNQSQNEVRTSSATTVITRKSATKKIQVYNCNIFKIASLFFIFNCGNKKSKFLLTLKQVN